jgi:hypothetical protein
MELSLAMRYCMVQAQKAALGNLMCAEQLYSAILSLYGMEPEEIILETKYHVLVNTDLKAVAHYVMIHNLDVNATCECIAEQFAQYVPLFTPTPNTDIPGLLVHAEKCAKQAGHKAIMAADLLEVLETSSLVPYYLQNIEDPLDAIEIPSEDTEVPIKAKNVSHVKESHPDRQTFSMNTMMLNVRGTPCAIFLGYLFRALLIPCTTFYIIRIWNLHPNAFWRAVFWIYGFIAAYETLRVLLVSIRLTSKSRLVNFLEGQLYCLGLPGFGLFLMWYFHWFPMPPWLFWLYLFYGIYVWPLTIIFGITSD